MQGDTIKESKDLGSLMKMLEASDSNTIEIALNILEAIDSVNSWEGKLGVPLARAIHYVEKARVSNRYEQWIKCKDMAVKFNCRYEFEYAYSCRNNRVARSEAPPILRTYLKGGKNCRLDEELDGKRDRNAGLLLLATTFTK